MRRNMGRRSNVGNSAGGPLITGHLQDIDMELELLKRKREMIEQQQQLLVMEQQFKSSRHYDSYDQMRYNEPEQHGSNRDYASLYDNGPKHRNQFGRKRQAELQWQYEGSPKRTPLKRKTNPSQFNPMQGTGNAGPANRYQKPAPGSGYGSKASPKGPAPLMAVKTKQLFVGQKIINQKPSSKLPQKEFKPTKVSKPKASPTPNKIAAQPLAERKKLVSAANESVSETDVSRMLLPDRVPTQQVSGRLELALGAIMKNIRDMVGTESPHAIMLRSPQLQRVMKQAVRERIRTVMLGKVVGSLFDILEIYREEFPAETDVDIVNIALDAAGVPASEREDRSKLVEKGNPDEFFRLNMTCLLETKLIEMFENLEEMYAGKATAVDCGAENEKAVMELKTKSEEQKLLEDSKDFKSFLNTDIKARDVKRFLPRLMKKFIPYMVKLLNHNGIFQTTKAAITMKANENAGTVSNSKKGEGRGDSESTIFASGTLSNIHPSYNLPYFVKIMGRPTLPKRKIMQAFLNEYNPKSIKKHRTIHNLLFVGFSEKSDFDTMVAADGTVVGRSTLSVRICTKGGTQESTGQTGENKETDFSMDVTTDGDVKQEPKFDGEILNADLDDQITDLLSSIRKSEEDDDKETRVEVTDEKNDNEDETDAVAEQDNKSDENKPDENKSEENKPDGDQTTTIEEGDAQKDEEIDSKDADEHENQETATATVEDVQDNVDATVNPTEENIEDQSNEAEENQASDNAEAQNSEPMDETEKTSENSDNQEPEEQSKGDKDKVGDLRNNASSRATPTRMSARLASVTPSTILTRRTSRLANN